MCVCELMILFSFFLVVGEEVEEVEEEVGVVVKY